MVLVDTNKKNQLIPTVKFVYVVLEGIVMF